MNMDVDEKLETLMARYQAGDFTAARCLIERLSPQLHRFLDAQSATRADTDDTLQETWLRVHRVRHTYRPGEPLLPWIYAIARRARVDHYRKAIRTTVRELPLEDLPDGTAAAPSVFSHAEDLEQLLTPLSPSQREILKMLKVAGMSLEEVARATSCSVGSVKQKVHRAYETLRRTMRLKELEDDRRGALP
jgi:RNA polymerase sigma-70 factor (ECF subfamily)